jgi:hypothetical protein
VKFLNIFEIHFFRKQTTKFDFIKWKIYFSNQSQIGLYQNEQFPTESVRCPKFSCDETLEYIEYKTEYEQFLTNVSIRHEKTRLVKKMLFL